MIKVGERQWSCAVCKGTPTKWSQIAPKRCTGSAASKWAAAAGALATGQNQTGGGHTRMLSGETLWRRACGGHASNFAKTLQRPCSGVPHMSWKDGVLVRMNLGRSINLESLKAGSHQVTRARPPAIPEPNWASTIPTPVAEPQEHTPTVSAMPSPLPPSQSASEDHGKTDDH